MQSILKTLLFSFLTISLISSCAEDETPTPDTNPNFGLAPVNVDKTKMLDLVNSVRQAGCKCGSTDFPPVAAVQWNETVEAAADKHSEYMDSIDELTHIGSGSTNGGERLEAEGFSINPGTWAENIAKGFADEQSVFDVWKGSEGHCKNIMKDGVTELGVGTSGAYWTMLLAGQ